MLTDAQPIEAINRPIDAPPDGGVGVWMFWADAEAETRARAVLSAEEIEDLDRLAVDRDRRTGAVSRAVWRRAAAGMLKTSPEGVVVERTPYGRPCPSGLDRTVGDLSTSHAGNLVTLAVGRGVRVGVDVEATAGATVDDHVNRAVETVTGPAIELIPDRTERMLFAWCVLEALLKADGRGMHLSPGQVSTDIRTLWGWNAAWVGGAAWWVRRFATPAGYVGAVAAASPVIELAFHDPD